MDQADGGVPSCSYGCSHCGSAEPSVFCVVTSCHTCTVQQDACERLVAHCLPQGRCACAVGRRCLRQTSNRTTSGAQLPSCTSAKACCQWTVNAARSSSPQARLCQHHEPPGGPHHDSAGFFLPESIVAWHCQWHVLHHVGSSQQQREAAATTNHSQCRVTQPAFAAAAADCTQLVTTPGTHTPTQHPPSVHQAMQSHTALSDT
jgi:hypothetical protein